jgi:hypothetical protein
VDAAAIGEIQEYRTSGRRRGREVFARRDGGGAMARRGAARRE